MNITIAFALVRFIVSRTIIRFACLLALMRCHHNPVVVLRFTVPV